ncbi:MAG: signal peptidase I [Ignisphaera sp.]
MAGRVRDSFFRKTYVLLSSIYTLIFVVLFVLLISTVLSRLGVLNLFGVSIVFSSSMEPSLRRGDLVFYINTGYQVGDVIVYCRTPSYCVVHRLVDVSPYNRDVLITRGDANPVDDPPVPRDVVRGRVVFSIAWEFWVPLSVLFTAFALYDIARSGALGYSYVILFAIMFTYILAVYALIPQPIIYESVEPPLVMLSGVYFNPADCSVDIRYRGGLSLTNVSVHVNSVYLDVLWFGEREVVIRPPPELLGHSFEYRRPLVIEVYAQLNRIGRLLGNYTLLVGGRDLEPAVQNGVLFIKNPNCFPVTANVSVRYSDGAVWSWANHTYVLEGYSYVAMEVPEGYRYAYAYIYWLNQGDLKWIGLPLRIG